MATSAGTASKPHKAQGVVSMGTSHKIADFRLQISAQAIDDDYVFNPQSEICNLQSHIH
jgi:hypothetical protein